MGNTVVEVSGRFGGLGLFLARFCSSAWIGAAALFVVVGVREVTRSGFDSTTKDTLVAIRFPAFYLCGLILVSFALIGTWLAGNRQELSKGRRIVATLALIVVLALMFVDYVWIYLPLLRLVTPPGQPRDTNFIWYHEASKWINFAGLAFCLIASLLVNLPPRRPKSIKE